MSFTPDQQTIGPKRQEILCVFPCFSSFTDEQIAELAALTQEIAVPAKTVIVKEHDLVDSVYFIINGEAEVTREMPYRIKKRQVPVAMLQAGESIGLNDTGFYSQSGKRTATVTSITAMTLLKLDIKDLYTFLQKHQLESTMAAASHNMLRMRFIKQSLPFAKLSHERLQLIAEHVDEISIPAETIIFKQGDRGDKCYLIRSGKVEITAIDDNGNKKQLAELKSPALFGEATLITHSPRNATAKALETTELFELRHDYLSELLESESNVANMFMTLMVDRSRPCQNAEAILHQHTTADNQDIIILKNPKNNAYFKLSPEGEFIWKQLDGKHTLQEMTLNLAEKFNVFAPDMVVALISRLTKAGFVTNVELYQENQGKRNWLLRAGASIKKMMDTRYAFGDADKWISKTYNKYLFYFFTKPVQIILVLFALTGISVFAASTNDVLDFFSINHAGLWLLLTLFPLSYLEIFLHELGHAFAVKAFGREIHFIGIGWYYFSPVAFADTSDMWLATRKQRMLVNLAGVYVDIIVAGLVSLAILVIQNMYVQSILWLFALYTYINAFRMMSPLQELDGYYFLSDWLDKPHLRKSAVLWLIKKFSRSAHPSLSGSTKPQIYYWLACCIYLILVTIITLALQTFVFAVLGMKVNNPYLVLALPFLILLISSFSIIAEIRSQE